MKDKQELTLAQQLQAELEEIVETLSTNDNSSDKQEENTSEQTEQ